jgi:hypothetical protein
VPARPPACGVGVLVGVYTYVQKLYIDDSDATRYDGNQDGNFLVYRKFNCSL